MLKFICGKRLLSCNLVSVVKKPLALLTEQRTKEDRAVGHYVGTFSHARVFKRIGNTSLFLFQIIIKLKNTEESWVFADKRGQFLSSNTSQSVPDCPF